MSNEGLELFLAVSGSKNGTRVLVVPNDWEKDAVWLQFEARGR